MAFDAVQPDTYCITVHKKSDVNILFSSFCSGIQGYLKHSSNKCVGVNAGKLVFEASCTSAEQVFYKEKFSSFLIHVASGKCVANPDPVGAV